jgi:hypothetical protein
LIAAAIACIREILATNGLSSAWWSDRTSSAGFAGAILVLGEASEGAVEAPSDDRKGAKPPSEEDAPSE